MTEERIDVSEGEWVIEPGAEVVDTGGAGEGEWVVEPGATIEMAQQEPGEWVMEPGATVVPKFQMPEHQALMKGDPLDTRMEEDHGWLKSSRTFASMHWIRDGASRALRKNKLNMTGAEVRQAIDRGERTHGEPGGIPDDPFHFGVQLAANVLSGAAGLLTAPIMFGVDFAATGGRELAEGAAKIYARFKYGPPPDHPPYYYGISSDEAIRRGIDKRQFTWSAHRKRLESRTTEGIRMAVMSLSPAVTMSVLAEDKERASAFWEGMYTFPVESIVGPLFMAKGFGHIGGKKVSVFTGTGKIRKGEGTRVPLQNMKGKRVKLNTMGQVVHDMTPEAMRPYFFDTDDPRRTYAMMIRDEAHKKRSPHTARIANEYAAKEGEMFDMYAKLDAAFTEEYGTVMDHADFLSALELHKPTGVKGQKAEKMDLELVDTLMPTPEIVKASEGMFDVLLRNGMKPEEVDTWYGYMSKAGTDLANKGALTPEGRLLIDSLGDIRSAPGSKGFEKFESEFVSAEGKMFESFHQSLVSMEKAGDLPGYIESFLRPRGKILQEDVFSNASNRFRTWARNNEKGATRFNFKDAAHEKRVWEKTYASALEAARADGKNYSLQVSSWGEVRRTVGYGQFKKAVRMLDRDDMAGRQMVMATLMEYPTTRIRNANLGSPLERTLQDMMTEGGPLHWYKQQTRELSLSIATDMGIDPMVLAQKLDTYMSRSFRDFMDAQIFLAEELSLDAATQVHAMKSPRYRRKLSSIKSDSVYNNMVELGHIDPNAAAKSTVAVMSALADRLAQFRYIESDLRKARLLQDKRPIGRAGGRWVEVSTRGDAPPGKRASGDPYNFMYGSLAGKWVHPSVARQLKLTSAYWKKSSPALQLFKLFKTAFNPYGYHVRNELGDTANVIAASGFSPLFGLGKKLRGEATLEVDNYATHGTMTNELALGIHYGDTKPERMGSVMMEANINTPAQKEASGLLSAIFAGDYRKSHDIVESNQNVARSALGILLHHTVPKTAKGVGGWVKGSLKNPHKRLWKALKDNVREFNEQYLRHDSAVETTLPETTAGVFAQEYMKSVGKQKGRTLSAWVAGSKALDKMVHDLTMTGLAEWTSRRENIRRQWAFKVALRGLKMPPREAGQFVKNVLHDYSDRPPGFAAFQSSTMGQHLLAPPFLTYGYKQAAFSTRRVMNSPQHFVYGVMDKALEALEAQRSLDEGREDSLVQQFRFGSLTDYGAQHMLLGTSEEISDALEYIGYRREFVDAFRGAKRDKDGNIVSINNMTMLLPLRDLVNLNTALSNFNPHDEPMRMLSRLNPFARALFTAVEESGKDYATGKASDINDPDNSAISHKLSVFVDIFAPFGSIRNKMFDPLGLGRGTGGREAIRMVGTATGAWGDDWEAKRDRSGNPTHPIQSWNLLFPFSPIHPIDKLHLMHRIGQKHRAKMFDAQKRKRAYLRQYNMFEPDDRPMFHLAELNLKYAELTLGHRIYNTMNLSKDYPDETRRFNEMKASYKKTRARLKKEGQFTHDDINKDLPDSFYGTAGMFLDTITEVWKEFGNEQ